MKKLSLPTAKQIKHRELCKLAVLTAQTARQSEIVARVCSVVEQKVAHILEEHLKAQKAQSQADARDRTYKKKLNRFRKKMAKERRRAAKELKNQLQVA